MRRSLELGDAELDSLAKLGCDFESGGNVMRGSSCGLYQEHGPVGL